MRGYTLKVEALTEILSFLSSYEDAEDEALELLLDELQHQSCSFHNPFHYMSSISNLKIFMCFYF